MNPVRLRGVIAACVVILAFLPLMGGCGSDSNPTSPGATYQPPPASSGNGLLALEIDAFGVPGENAAKPDPGTQGPKNRTEIADIILAFDSIRVYGACADSDSVGHDDDMPGHEDDDDHDCPPYELLTDSVTVALGGLSDSLQSLLGTLVLPEGHYRHIRLHILEAWVVTAEDDTVSADVPSGDESGLKVKVDFDVVAGEVSEIVISVDLSRAVIETPPGSGNFKIKPVFHGHRKGHGHDGDEDEDDDGEGDA